MQGFKKNIITAAVALLALSPTLSYASLIDDSTSAEVVGVSLKGLKMCHQREWRNITVNLEYNSDVGGAASDIQLIKGHIRQFLDDYSNPDDFWEIMNTKLIHSLVETFPDIITMKSTLSLEPDRTLTFPRSTIVKFERDSDDLKESFRFTKLNYLICQETFQSLDLHVTWEMKENPGAFDYPDYQWIDQTMSAYFAENPVSFSEWKSLKPQLQAYLLEKYPTLESIEIEVTIVE